MARRYVLKELREPGRRFKITTEVPEGATIRMKRLSPIRRKKRLNPSKAQSDQKANTEEKEDLAE